MSNVLFNPILFSSGGGLTIPRLYRVFVPDCAVWIPGRGAGCWRQRAPPLSSVRQFAPTLDRQIGQDRDPVILLDPARLTTHSLEPAPCQDDVMANTISSLVREGGEYLYIRRELRMIRQ